MRADPFVFPGARFDDGAGGDNEVQRTMLELINQLDGFDPRGNIKVLMATNRPDTLDPALMRPGRLDRKIEFSLPDRSERLGHRQRPHLGLCRPEDGDAGHLQQRPGAPARALARGRRPRRENRFRHVYGGQNCR